MARARVNASHSADKFGASNLFYEVAVHSQTQCILCVFVIHARREEKQFGIGMLKDFLG
jgi:hypothetical protein